MQWKQKQQIFLDEKKNEQEMLKNQQKQEEYMNQLIQEEKERLLREHLINLQGYAPKGLMDRGYENNYNRKYQNQSNIKL